MGKGTKSGASKPAAPKSGGTKGKPKGSTKGK